MVYLRRTTMRLFKVNEKTCRFKIENDIYSQVRTGISKEGFVVAVHAVIKDATKFLTNEQQKRKDRMIINWNNKLADIKSTNKAKPTKATKTFTFNPAISSTIYYNGNLVEIQLVKKN